MWLHEVRGASYRGVDRKVLILETFLNKFAAYTQFSTYPEFAGMFSSTS